MREEVIIRENGRKRVIFHFDDPSLTRQEFKDDCDLAKIIERFSSNPEGLEALLNAQNYVQSRFDDVSGFVDYRTAIEQVQRAEEAFLKLPALVRTKFDNDPAKFLDFVDDPKNLDELRSLGLAKPVEEVSKKPETPAG